MRIPICTPPYEDELWAGYLMRLSCVNGYANPYLFFKRYFQPDDKNIGTIADVRSPSGIFEAVSRISNTNNFPTLADVFNMIPYYYMAAKLPYKKQAKLFESILYTKRPCVPAYKNKGRQMYYLCPECIRIDKLVYGEAYLHLTHHIPGICVCVQHNVKLVSIPKCDYRRSIKDFFDKDYHIEKKEVRTYLPEKLSHILIDTKCDICGAQYPMHPFSDYSKAGCPFCNNNLSDRDIVQRRLDVLYPNAYEIVSDFDAITLAEIRHIPCGNTKRHLDTLLYNGESDCKGCKSLTRETIQKRIDPLMLDYVVLPVTEKQRKCKRVKIIHKSCGRQSDVLSRQLQEKGYCPVCDSKVHAIDITRVDPDYVFFNYKNNRAKATILHRHCGIVFETSKTSFLSGRRCPVCTIKYTYHQLYLIVEEYAGPQYSIAKSDKRGHVDIYFRSELIASKIENRKVITDLSEATPLLFKERIKIFRPEKSKRRRIYDAIKEQTMIKGFWEFSDGVPDLEMTRIERNILQDMCKAGFVHRISKGEYSTCEIKYPDISGRKDNSDYFLG